MNLAATPATRDLGPAPAGLFICLALRSHTGMDEDLANIIRAHGKDAALEGGMSARRTRVRMVLRGLALGVCLWLIAAPALAALGKSEIRELEGLLADLGFDPGPVDGVLDEQTRTAIKGYQDLAALPVTGQASSDLLNELREVTDIMGDVRIPEAARKATTTASEELAIAPAGANPHQFACMRGEMTRLVYIEYSDAIGEPPCSVVYESSSPEQSSRNVPWRASHQKGFCEARAKELVEKLRSSDWWCSPLGG